MSNFLYLCFVTSPPDCLDQVTSCGAPCWPSVQHRWETNHYCRHYYLLTAANFGNTFYSTI